MSVWGEDFEVVDRAELEQLSIQAAWGRYGELSSLDRVEPSVA